MLTYKGICEGDNIYHYEVVQNFIRTGNLSLPDGKYNPDSVKWLRGWMAKGRDNKVYLTLGPGMSIVSIPFGLVGYALEKIINIRKLKDTIKNEQDTNLQLYYLRKMPSAFFSGLINPILSALILLIFYSFCLNLSSSPTKSLVSALLLGCGTIIWPYSCTYWTQPIITLCFISAFYFIHLYAQNEKSRYLVYAGLVGGYAIVTRPEAILIIPWFILYILFIQWPNKRKLLDALSIFIVPVLFFIVLQMLWNYHRFGDFLQTGAIQKRFIFYFRGKLYISLLVNLVSINRSIFIYSPPLILFFFSIKNIFIKYKNMTIIILGIVLTYLIFYSKYIFWMSATSWGPRFLVPLAPLILLPVCLFIANNRIKKIFTGILLSIGVFIQLIAVLIPPQYQAMGIYMGDEFKPMEFFLKSEIVPQAQMLFNGHFEFWWLNSPIAFVFGIFFMIICLISLYFLINMIIKRNQFERI